LQLVTARADRPVDLHVEALDGGRELVDVIEVQRNMSAWWAAKRPSTARRSCGIFGRIRVWAGSAKAATSRTPTMSASSI